MVLVPNLLASIAFPRPPWYKCSQVTTALVLRESQSHSNPCFGSWVLYLRTQERNQPPMVTSKPVFGTSI